MFDNPYSPVKILLATCDCAISENLLALLSDSGCEVYTADCYSRATYLLEQEKPDIVLTDVFLKDTSGYSLCMYIKGKHPVPVIFLSAFSDENSIVTAFEKGADDYIIFPFRTKEFLSRITACLRRSKKDSNSLMNGRIQIDTVKGIVTKDGKEIYLSSLEYRILLFFAQNKGKILSREDLLKEIWDDEGYINDNTLTVYIKRIRDKFEDTSLSPQVIKTVRGKGYMTIE